MAHRVKVTLEHHLNRRYHAVNHGRGRRPADTKYGKFNLRFRHEGKRIRLPLEAMDLSAALQARSDKEQELNAIPVVKHKGVTLDEAINIYLTTGKAAQENWRKHTVQCYALALKLLRQSCGKARLDEIDGGDLRQFKVFLRAQKTSVGKKIDPRTVYNHFNNTVAFLNTHGKRNLVTQAEWPEFEKKKVVCYDEGDMRRLLEFATDDERDVLEFFLGVGFRNGEGTHVEWHDIDCKNCEVHTYSKLERFGWKVKDTEQRIIGIPDKVMERLAARRERHPGDGLVFSNSKGNPDTHMLRIIKRVALRAALNCGTCTGTYERKRVSCATHPVCRKWIIHTLRKTWATFQARSGADVPTLQHDLGHSSLATTLSYLAAEERRSARRRQQINAADARVRDVTEGAVKQEAAG